MSQVKWGGIFDKTCCFLCWKTMGLTRYEGFMVMKIQVMVCWVVTYNMYGP